MDPRKEKKEYDRRRRREFKGLQACLDQHVDPYRGWIYKHVFERSIVNLLGSRKKQKKEAGKRGLFSRLINWTLV